MTAGASLSTKKDNAASVTGSANYNKITNTTEAKIGERTNLGASGNLNVRSRNSADAITVAGGVAIGSKVALGAAADVEFVDNTISSQISGQDTVVDTEGDISISSTSHDNILSVSADVSATTGNLGISGAAASQNMITDMQSFVSDGATVQTEKSLKIASDEDTDLLIISGGAAGSKNAAIGVSVANGNVDRSVKSYIGDADVTAQSSEAARRTTS